MAALNVSLARFLEGRRLQLHCRSLTMSLIGPDSLKQFASGSWSKGQDSVVLMEFLPWVLEDLGFDYKGAVPWKYIRSSSCSVGDMMRILYADGVFLQPSRATQAGRWDTTS